MSATFVVLFAIAANPAVGRFAVDHPKSTRVVTADGHVAHVSGFLADTGANDAEAAAREFLERYADAFGLQGQSLVPLGAPPPGEAGAAKFSRTIDGLPVFGSNLVVGVDESAQVFLVNSGPTATAVSGRHALGETSAYWAAVASLGGDAQVSAAPAIVAGWRPMAGTARAVYRVDFIAQRPAGDWRVFVDGETGKVLFRQDLRYRLSAPGSVFEVSPAETGAAPCPLSGSGGRSLCAAPVDVTFSNLVTGADLTGTQTTVYDCNGANFPAGPAAIPGACVAVAASGGGFAFPVDTTRISRTDDFAAAMAYYHLDRHVSFFKSLDPNPPPSSINSSRALRGSLPAVVNTLDQGAAFDNAFFSGFLDAMVFGQGTNADFAYDATVMYHEFTHGAVFAWGDYNIDIDSLGGLDEPGALNEGTADAMAASETGRSAIGGFIGSTFAPPTAALRDMSDPDLTRSCQGDGTVVSQFGAASVNGFDGEVHDDGEVWNGYFWEVFDGLRTAGVKACGGACNAGPAIQYKTMQLAGGTSPTFNTHAQTFKAAAGALFPERPSVAAYADCVSRRRKLDACDRTVPLYAGETKVQYIRLRYSPFQVVLHATASTSFDICSALGTTTTVHARNGQPVQLSGIDPNTANATVTADRSVTFTKACANGTQTVNLGPGGTWYLLLDSPDALVGGNPGVDLYKYGASTSGMASRPASAAPITCTPPFPLSISLEVPSIPPRAHMRLTASGGSGAGFTWALATNNSGGSIVASSGAYTAGATGSATDTVRVTDSLGETTTRTLGVSAGVTVSPATASLPPKARQAFTASGGSGAGFTWALVANGSGGSIDAAGNYTGGATGNVTDVVQATDSLGNTATATIAVSAPPKSGGCSSGGGDPVAALLAGAALAGQRLLRRRHRP